MIDIHSHLGNWEYFPKFFINGIVDSMFAKLEKEEQTPDTKAIIEHMAKSMLSDKTGKKQLRQAEKAGIDKSVLLIVDFFYDEKNEDSSLIEQINKEHYELQKENADNFIVFSGVDPRRKKGMQILEQSVSEYGFKGLKLYPPCGFELDDKELDEYYSFCQEKGIPVLAHTGPSLGSMKITSRLNQSVQNVVAKFHNLKLILAHAGILYIDDAIELGRYDNVYVDISGFQKELQNTEEANQKFVRLFEQIPEKVLFGTDWPLFNFNTPQNDWVNKLEQLAGLTAYRKELLFEKNAKEILNL